MRPFLTFFMSILLMGSLIPLAAQDDSSSEDADKPTMLVVVSDSLVSNRAYHNDLDMYLRIKANFTKVFEKEDWPVKLEFQRWSASVPDGGLQLRIWFTLSDINLLSITIIL